MGVIGKQLLARHEAAVRAAEFLIAIPAPVLPQPRKEAAQSLNTRLLPDHQ
jgi:hypothetical protein